MATSVTSNFSEGFIGSNPEVSMEMHNPVTISPSAELCRRGSCYTLIRGDSNNTEQPSYPAPGFGAPCARAAPGGAPQSLCPPRARWQRCSTATAGLGPGGSSRDSQHRCQTEPQPRSPGGKMLQLRGVTARAPRTACPTCGVRLCGATAKRVPRRDHLRSFPGAPSLIPGPVAPNPSRPDLLPPASIPSPGRAHKGRRSPSPALPHPAPAAPPSPLPALMGPPGDALPAPRGRGAGEEEGTHGDNTDTDAAVAQLRAAAQPRPRRARAGTLLLGGRSPLTPSRSPCRPHSPRPHRARPGADRARRPPTRTEPAAPPPPAASSLPLYPAAAERQRAHPISARRHIATRG